MIKITKTGKFDVHLSQRQKKRKIWLVCVAVLAIGSGITAKNTYETSSSLSALVTIATVGLLILFGILFWDFLKGKGELQEVQGEELP